MLTLHRRTIPAAVLTLALGWGIAGCSSDEATTGTGTGTGTGNAVVGTWNATSLHAQGGMNLIAQGMAFSLVFNSNGTFAHTTTNDMAGFCDPGMANCGDSGPYTASDRQFTLDAGTSDAITFDYSIAGTRMTITGTVNGTAFIFDMDKV